jgi:profilin
MSWLSLLDEKLKSAHSSAIIGFDSSVWAQNSNFPQLKPEEFQQIQTVFVDFAAVASRGLMLGGIKYMVNAKNEEMENLVTARKESALVLCYKAKEAYITAIYDKEKSDLGNSEVVSLGEYLDQSIFESN